MCRHMKDLYKISGFLMLFVFGLSSCINDESSSDCDCEETVSLVLSIFTGRQTRASVDVSRESYVDPASLTIKLYDSSNRFKADVRIKSYSEKEAVAEVMGEVSRSEIESGFFKVVVTANADVPDGGSQVEDATYAYDSSYIPMWGVISDVSLDTDIDESQYLGKIHMVRAMAKFEIKFDDTKENLKDFKMLGVKLNRVAASGHVAPAEWLNRQSSKGTTPEDFFNPVRDTQVENVEFLKAGENDYVVYIPEAEYSPEDFVTVTVERGGRQLDFIYNIMADEADRKVVRNYHHIYTVTEVRMDRLVVDVQVMEWNPYILNLEFSDIYIFEEHQGILWKEGTYDYIDYDRNIVYMKNDGTFLEGSFHLSHPLGAEWYASLNAIKGSPDELMFIYYTYFVGTVNEGTEDNPDFVEYTEDNPKEIMEATWQVSNMIRNESQRIIIGYIPDYYNPPLDLNPRVELNFVLRVGSHTIIPNFVDGDMSVSKAWIIDRPKKDKL